LNIPQPAVEEILAYRTPITIRQPNGDITEGYHFVRNNVNPHNIDDYRHILDSANRVLYTYYWNSDGVIEWLDAQGHRLDYLWFGLGSDRLFVLANNNVTINQDKDNIYFDRPRAQNNANIQAFADMEQLQSGHVESQTQGCFQLSSAQVRNLFYSTEMVLPSLPRSRSLFERFAYEMNFRMIEHMFKKTGALDEKRINILLDSLRANPRLVQLKAIERLARIGVPAMYHNLYRDIRSVEDRALEQATGLRDLTAENYRLYIITMESILLTRLLTNIRDNPLPILSDFLNSTASSAAEHRPEIRWDLAHIELSREDLHPNSDR